MIGSPAFTMFKPNGSCVSSIGRWRDGGGPMEVEMLLNPVEPAESNMAARISGSRFGKYGLLG